MVNQNEIVLFSREEAEQTLNRQLTDFEWEKLREWITTDDNMWSVIDESISQTLKDLKLVKYVGENNG